MGAASRFGHPGAPTARSKSGKGEYTEARGGVGLIITSNRETRPQTVWKVETDSDLHTHAMACTDSHTPTCAHLHVTHIHAHGKIIDSDTQAISTHKGFPYRIT